MTNTTQTRVTTMQRWAARPPTQHSHGRTAAFVDEVVLPWLAMLAGSVVMLAVTSHVARSVCLLVFGVDIG